MELEYCSDNEGVISNRINLYPWIRWNPRFSDRVLSLQPDIELCNSSVIDSLPVEISCLTVCDVGIMCNIPAVCSHSMDISLEPASDLAIDDTLYKHASESHLEAADQLLSVLTDAVCLRVTCQDSKCHVCLLHQHGADSAAEAKASKFDLPVSCSTNMSNILDKLASGISAMDFADESRHDCSLNSDNKTGLCDVRPHGCSQMTEHSDAVCNHLSYASAHQSLSSASLDASTAQVCYISL